MNESSNRRRVIVGAFILIGLLFLVGGILVVGNLHETFKKKMRVVALFEDVSGLQTGNNIWFSGVKIGTVSSLQFYGNSKVRVLMRIETNAKEYIKKDAKVKISTDGLIGNKIIIIYGGSSRVPSVTDGDTLTVEKTFSSDDVMNTLQANNNNLLAITGDFKSISRKLAKGEGTVGKFLSDTAVYSRINTAVISLQQASAGAHKLLESLNEFSNGLNKNGTLANELVHDTVVFNSLRTSVNQLQQMSSNANALVEDLHNAVKDTASAIGILLHDQETASHLKATISNLESSSQKLDEDLEAAQHNFLLRKYFKKKNK
jgi:phospholipid/cholesterol/gamma-HCH transport system substrate-binding protein